MTAVSVIPPQDVLCVWVWRIDEITSVFYLIISGIYA